jgi:hypothetical protein
MEDNKKSNEDIETSENNEELEETQDESQEEESNESEESYEDTDDDSDEKLPSLEDYNEAKAKLKEFEEKNKQLYARLKKGEQKPLQTKNKEGMTEEQLIKVAKIASSLDDDDLEVLGTITGNSIADKMTNPLFKAYKEQKERKKRSEASALKPSSPNIFTSKKDPNNPELSEDDHKKMVEQMMK